MIVLDKHKGRQKGGMAWQTERRRGMEDSMVPHRNNLIVAFFVSTSENALVTSSSLLDIDEHGMHIRIHNKTTHRKIVIPF